MIKGIIMERIRCSTCAGSGQVMGGGMMMWDCDSCDGAGKIIKQEPRKFKMSKTDKSYKKAVKEIQDLDPSLTKEEAQKIMDDELARVE